MTPQQMKKVIQERQDKYENIKQTNGIPDKIQATENQRKVIKDKYIKVADSLEEWLRIVSRNIALAELLHHDEFKDEIFKGVDYEEKTFEFENHNLPESTTYYLHAGKDDHDAMEDNFDKFIENLERVADNNEKAGRIVKEMEDLFYSMMSQWDFLPNSPTLMNAGRDLQQLSACYVLPVEDSVEGWGDAVKNTMLIHKSGGGTGFSGCRVRPRGSIVQSTKGVASGPMSVFKMVDAMTQQIKQGGMRRGANMGILPYHHPDIEEFVNSKKDNDELENFNISVAIDSDFMKAVKNDEEIELVNPHTDKVEGQIRAQELWNTMIENAWATGDPGFVNLERINESRSNPTPEVGQIESTNPCVTGDTLISTDEGLVSIEELANREGGSNIYVDSRTETVESNNLLMNQLGTRLVRATKAWKTGVKDTYKVKTKSGYEVEATADHKVLTKEGWKEVQDLTEDDKLLIQSDEGGFPENAELPTSFNGYTQWNKKLGQVLGWLVGDGWLRSGDENRRAGFCFGEKDTDVFKELKPFLNKLYGKEIKEVERENGTIHLSYHSKPFVNFFKELGVKPVKSKEKVMPESLFRASEDAVKGFLQALFTADGTVSASENKTHYVRLSSKSRRLLEGVQKLLVNLGIKSKIYNRSRPSRKVFAYENKDGDSVEYDSDGVLYELQISKDLIPKFMDEVGFMSERHSDKIEKLDKVNYYTTQFEDELDSVTYVGEKPVYDLTEPLTHSFIGNGLVLHNCGEQPLLPYEPCNLGSIKLANFVIEDEENPRIDWDRLRNTVHLAIHFLDNVIDINNYPLPEIEKIAKENRRIGLGVMGWAEMLTKLHIPYNSDKAYKLAEEVMQFINENALEASENLAAERGVFPNWEDSIYDPQGENFDDKEAYPRNCARTTIAPTGTIGIASGCQGAGIEPYFAAVYTRYTAEGIDAIKRGEEPDEKHTYYEVNKELKRVAEKKDYWGMEPEELWEKIDENDGSLVGIDEIPEEVQGWFLTAHDLTPEDHVKVQAAFQRHVDNGVSKTVNFDHDATTEDVKEVYELAYELGCKGVTIYRDGSKDEQVLNKSDSEEESEDAEEQVETVEADQTSESSVSPEGVAPAKQAAGQEASAYYELETGYGPVHIHINYDAEGPKKVFANLSPTGTEISGLTTACGILLSKYLEEGGDAKDILRHLNSIKGDKPHGFGKNRIDSIPHAISVALKDHLVKTGKLETGQTKLDFEDKKVQDFDEDGDDQYCPECYSQNVAMVSGCDEPVCFDCGYSKCG